MQAFTSDKIDFINIRSVENARLCEKYNQNKPIHRRVGFRAWNLLLLASDQEFGAQFLSFQSSPSMFLFELKMQLIIVIIDGVTRLLWYIIRFICKNIIEK